MEENGTQQDDSAPSTCCPNGHSKSAGESFCSECGVRLLPSELVALNGDSTEDSQRRVKFQLPSKSPKLLVPISASRSWIIFALLLGADVTTHLAFQLVFLPLVVKVAWTVFLYAQAVRWLSPLSRGRAVLLLATSLAVVLVNDFLIYPLHGLVYGWSWTRVHFSGRDLATTLGIVGLAVAINTYFVAEQRSAVRAWVTPSRNVLDPAGIGLAIVLVLAIPYVVFIMTTGSYRIGLANWKLPSDSPTTAATNPYPYGTSVDEIRNDVRSHCSGEFGEQLAVSTHPLQTTSSSYYFGLYSGQDGAGTAVVDLDTGSITCKRL